MSAEWKPHAMRETWIAEWAGAWYDGPDSSHWKQCIELARACVEAREAKAALEAKYAQAIAEMRKGLDWWRECYTWSGPRGSCRWCGELGHMEPDGDVLSGTHRADCVRPAALRPSEPDVEQARRKT